MLRTLGEETLLHSVWLLDVGIGISFCSLSRVPRATNIFLGQVLWCYRVYWPILQARTLPACTEGT
jgi:hypothetical protein